MVKLIIRTLSVPMSAPAIAKHLGVEASLVRYYLKMNPDIFTVAYSIPSVGRNGATDFWKVKDERHQS